MKTVIYDYADRPVEIELKDDRITKIFVKILSGDEVIEVYYKDGSCEKFDSSNDRTIDYFDGTYIVSKDKVQQWLNFEFSGKNTNSYERQHYFDREEE